MYNLIMKKKNFRNMILKRAIAIRKIFLYQFRSISYSNEQFRPCILTFNGEMLKKIYNYKFKKMGQE
jgi:hypothetical protein